MFMILFGRLGQVVVLLMASKLATTYLSPSDVGAMSLLLTLISGFALLLINPVGMYVSRRLHSWVRTGNAPLYFLQYGVYLLLAGLLASFATVLLQTNFNVVPGISLPWVLTILNLSLFFNTANQTFIPSLNLLSFRGWFVILTLATSLLSLLLSVFITRSHIPRAEYWQLGQVLGQAVVAVLAGIVFFRLIRATAFGRGTLLPSRRSVVTLLSFAWPLLVAVSLQWVQTQSYRFFMGRSLGLHALGLFVAGYGISTAIISSFESLFATYLLPGFYHKISTDDPAQQDRAWQTYARAFFPALLLTLVYITVFPRELSRLLLGSQFQGAYPYVVWGALAEAGRVAISTYAHMAHARMQTTLLVLPSGVGALTALAAVWFLTPGFGVLGVGVALVAANLFALLVIHLSMVKRFVVVLPWLWLLKAAGFAAILAMAVFFLKTFLRISDTMVSTIGVLGASGTIYAVFIFLLLPVPLRAGCASRKIMTTEF